MSELVGLEKEEGRVEDSGFKRILVPFDGSEHAHKAVRVAADLARRHGSELIFLHVSVTPSILIAAQTGIPSVDLTEYRKTARTKAEVMLEKMEAIARQNSILTRSAVC